MLYNIYYIGCTVYSYNIQLKAMTCSCANNCSDICLGFLKTVMLYIYFKYLLF